MIKRLLILFVLFLTGGLLSAQDFLNHYLETAAANNAGLKAAFYKYSAALEKIPQANALPDPAVAFGYFIQPVETRNGPQEARISVNQMFPWFGTLKARGNAADYMAKSDYEKFEELKSELFYSVRSEYYEIYFIRKKTAIISERIRNLEILENLVQSRRETGKVSAVDELRISMLLDELRNDVKILKELEKSHVLQFTTLLNVEDTLQIRFPEALDNPVLKETREELWDHIRENNHQIQALTYLREAAGYGEIAAQKQGLPQFSVGLDYGIIGTTSNMADNPGKDVITFPTLGLTLPLNRKKYRAIRQEAEFTRLSAEENLTEQLNRTLNRFDETYWQFTDADRRSELYQSLVQKSGSALEMLKTAYMSQGSDFEEILRMERQQLDYAVSLEKALRDLRKSYARLNYFKGE